MVALEKAGLAGNTRILYTSDHGESAGVRGMWGKSVLYEEAALVPLIIAGAGVTEGAVCTTPVSLVDAHPTILEAMGLNGDNTLPGRSLYDIANAPDDPERPVFSEYHAMRSPSGSYMLRLGRYKYIHYVGYAPELFDLADDPGETRNLAAESSHAALLSECEAELRALVDPEAIDARAKADQKALVERYGGPEAVAARAAGGNNYTEVPPEVLAEL